MSRKLGIVVWCWVFQASTAACTAITLILVGVFTAGSIEARLLALIKMPASASCFRTIGSFASITGRTFVNARAVCLYVMPALAVNRQDDVRLDVASNS